MFDVMFTCSSLPPPQSTLQARRHSTELQGRSGIMPRRNVGTDLRVHGKLDMEPLSQ